MPTQDQLSRLFCTFFTGTSSQTRADWLGSVSPPWVARADTTAALPFLLVFDGLSKQTSADWLLATPPGQTLGFLRLPRLFLCPVPAAGFSPWLVSLPSGASLARLAGLLWFAFRLAGGLVLGLVRLPWASVGLGLGVRGSDLRQMARLLFNTHISVPYASSFNLTLRRPSQGRSEAWRQPRFFFLFSSRRGHV